MEKFIRKLTRERDFWQRLLQPENADTRTRLDKIMALANDTRAPLGERAAAMAAIARVTAPDCGNT